MKVLFGLLRTYKRGNGTLGVLTAGVASFASLCAGTPALAATLQCSPGQIVVGSPPADPQYAVAGTTVEFGTAGWRIEHRLANGTVAARSSQYTMWDASANHSVQWRGRYTRNPNLFMIGEVFNSGIPHHLIYKEWLYDTSKGNALVILTQADCINVYDQNVLVETTPPSAEPTPPPQQSAQPQSNPEAEAARSKLIKDASAEYDECIGSQMKQVVPYSNESGEVLSQVIITNCHPQEQHVIDLIVAIYGSSRLEVEKIIKEAVESRKNNVLADIVTFRAELAKSLLSQPKTDNPPKVDNASKKDVGL
jgi:hypothetical protein